MNSPKEIKVIIPEIAKPICANTVSAKKNAIKPDNKVAFMHIIVSFKNFFAKKAVMSPTTTPKIAPPKVRLNKNKYLTNIPTILLNVAEPPLYI